MKKPNITPGPWRIKDHEIEDFRVFGNCEGGALARVIKANNFGGTAQDQANARLIAAAPAMAEALEDCAGVLRSIEDQLKGKSIAVTRILAKAREALTLAGYEF